MAEYAERDDGVCMTESVVYICRATAARSGRLEPRVVTKAFTYDVGRPIKL